MKVKEIWIDVVGYEGIYQVSNLGRVKSLKREVIRSNNSKKVVLPEKIMKTKLSINGYERVGLRSHGQKEKSVHRLVAEAFIPNPLNKPTVNHIDGDKLNNKLNNLEWATYSENHKHAFELGLKSQKGENHAQSRLTNEEVYQIKFGHEGLLQREVAEIYGIGFKLVSKIRLGERWKHITKELLRN